MVAAALRASVPRVTQQSTEEEVSHAASQALEHRLFHRLNDVEQEALKNPRRNIRMAHAVLVKMRKLEKELVDTPSFDAVSDRARAENILGDRRWVWAIKAGGYSKLLRQLAIPKPQAVNQALAEFDTNLARIEELRHLHFKIESTLDRLIDEMQVVRLSYRRTRIDLNRLWRNALDLIEWFDRYEPEMAAGLLHRVGKLRQEIEENWYDTQVLSRMIRDGDKLLGRHVTSRRAKRH